MLLTMDNTKLSTGMFGIGELNLSPIQSGPLPALKIPLVSNIIPARGTAPATFTRNSTATYIDANGVLQTVGINVPRFQNGRYLCETATTNRFLQSGTPATQVITVVSGTIYTVQCYGSGSITLSGAGTGSVIEGAPRTFTASSTSLICTVSGSLSRAQVETGTQATSYIPTTTTPMDRVADSLHYAVGDVITQGQGSLYYEFLGGNISSTVRRILNLSDGTYSNRIYPYIKDTGGVALICVTAGITTVSIGTATILSTLNKLLVSYETNSVKLYVNGVLFGTDTNCAIPINLTTLSIGCSHDGTLQLNTEIGNIKYFKEVLTKAQAIKLTTL